MIANAAVVITQQSTCTYVALALHKEVYSQLDINELKRLMPLQNNEGSDRRIATLCRKLIHTLMPVLEAIHKIPWTADKSADGTNKVPGVVGRQPNKGLPVFLSGRKSKFDQLMDSGGELHSRKHPRCGDRVVSRIAL